MSMINFEKNLRYNHFGDAEEAFTVNQLKKWRWYYMHGIISEKEYDQKYIPAVMYRYVGAILHHKGINEPLDTILTVDTDANGNPYQITVLSYDTVYFLRRRAIPGWDIAKAKTDTFEYFLYIEAFHSTAKAMQKK